MWPWTKSQFYPSCVVVVLVSILCHHQHHVEAYCEKLILAAKSNSAASHVLVPKHPGPHHVHIFGPASGNSYHPPEQVSPGQVFIMPKSTLSFEYTCVASAPVNWRYVGTAVSSPDISFERGRNPAATCFYMTIVFPSAVDEITGQYVCYQEPEPEIQSNFTLYAGNADNGFLIYRKQGIAIKDSMEGQPILQLPCVANSPNVNVSLWDKLRQNDDGWRPVPRKHYTYDPMTGVRLNKTETGDVDIYKCESTFSRQDAVYLTYKKPDEILVHPAAEFLTLPANKDSLQLECYATVPVTFTNFASPGLALEFPTRSLPSYSHENGNGSTSTSASMAAEGKSTGGKYGYKYGAVVTLSFDGDRSGIWNISCTRARTREDEQRGNGDTNIVDNSTTTTAGVLHSWEIQFTNEDFTPGLVFDSTTNTATCVSQAPSELRFHYVLCELLTQCQFLQPCLQDSQDWACPENLSKIPKQIDKNETSITVQLQDFSGALACIGVDVNETIYFHRTATNGKLNLDQNQTDLVAINLIGSWEILLGSLVQIECIASKRFFVNNLTFQLWAGDTMVKMLTQEYLSTEDSSLIAGMFIHRIQFKMTDNNVDRIVCAVPRYDGNTTEIQAVKVKVKKRLGQHTGSSVNWTAIVLGVSAAAFLIVVVVVMYFWRSTKVKAGLVNPGMMLSDMEFELLQRFREGSPQHLPKGDKDALCNGGGGGGVDRAGEEYLNIVEDGHYYAQMIPYNTSQHEISLDRLKIDRDPDGYKAVLGVGEYGIVYKGVFDNGTFGVPVAIKELKPNAQYVYLKALLSEIKIMIYVDKHENIVEFLGACTRSKLEACIVLRLYPYGTLEKYLRDHRQTLAYQNVSTIRSITNAGSGYVNPTELCVNDLIRWSLQIANALEYLFFKKVIHGDLATRNVLLDETLTAKVSDFGLARQRYTDYDFPKLSDMPLPWRWMSIESLRYLDFSQQSDLWSFGVTMWEIFSLAEIPYIGQRLSSSFLTDLENGVRLEQPANASDEMYELMRECWLTNPKDRITIHNIKRRLEVIVSNSAGVPSQPINYKQIEFRALEE